MVEALRMFAASWNVWFRLLFRHGWGFSGVPGIFLSLKWLFVGCKAFRIFRGFRCGQGLRPGKVLGRGVGSTEVVLLIFTFLYFRWRLGGTRNSGFFRGFQGCAEIRAHGGGGSVGVSGVFLLFPVLVGLRRL